MKILQTEDGFYRKDDIFCKKLYAPDNVDLSQWKLVPNEEYEKWCKETNNTDEFTIYKS